MACYLLLGVIKKSHNSHKPLLTVYLLPQKILDQTQAVHLLQESAGLFHSCSATGVLVMKGGTVWFSRDRAVCEGYTGDLEGNLHQGGCARTWERFEDFSEVAVTLAYKYLLNSGAGNLSANPVQN